MCGIIGYVGKMKASTILLDGLRKLEYRGYDSVGMATLYDSVLLMRKAAGKVDEVNNKLCFEEMSGNVGMAHTRWSTHGRSTDENAHPHTNKEKTICTVHNGIIENYAELKTELEQKGYTFASQTDTEVIPHLIDFYIKQGQNFEQAFTTMLGRIEGSYAILTAHDKTPGLMFARKGSPLVLGLGKNEHFISSDIPSFLQHTQTIVHLEDGDYGKISDKIEIYNNGKQITRQPTTAPWDIEIAKKGAYPHFMIKEINEQPLTIRKALNQPAELIKQTALLLQSASTVYLVGCGTSYNACATATYQFSKSGRQTIPILASEFIQHTNFIDNKTAIIAVSQSGETADVLDAVKLAKQKGATIIDVGINRQGRVQRNAQRPTASTSATSVRTAS
jgi:glucosamine--fructose-6-phosphate aminotransferase (isomerizing)